MTFRVRELFGSFEKRGPGASRSCDVRSRTKNSTPLSFLLRFSDFICSSKPFDLLANSNKAIVIISKADTETSYADSADL